MSKKNTYKRVNFQLPLSLARDFELAARNEGVTKAKLLRRWINSTSGREVNFKSKWPYSTFNLRLDSQTVSTIEKMAESTGTKTSTVLRNIIQTNINSSGSDLQLHSALSYTELRQQGRIGEIVDSIAEIQGDPNPRQLIALARSYLDLGKIAETLSILAGMNSSILTMSEELEVLLLKTESEIFNKEIYLAERHLSTLSAEMSDINNPLLVGHFHYLMGYYKEIIGDLQSSLNHYQLAIKHLSSTSNIADLSRAYAGLSVVATMFENTLAADLAIDKAINLSQSRSNNFLSRNHSFVKVINQSLVNTENALKLMQEARTGNNFQSPRFKYYEKSIESKAAFLRNDFDNSYKLMIQSESPHQSFRTKNNVRNSDYLRLFIESKHSYTKALSIMQDATTNTLRQPQPDYHKYMIASTKFLNGDQKDRSEGQIELKALADKGKYPLIRSSASKTLQSKAIQLAR